MNEGIPLDRTQSPQDEPIDLGRPDGPMCWRDAIAGMPAQCALPAETLEDWLQERSQK